MAVIAVVNRKGGSGKSTLATHLAAFYAGRGDTVMLGDVDRQQSTQGWLRQRAARALPHSAPIVGWAVDPRRVLRPPAGVRHVVLDTPAACAASTLPASPRLPTSSSCRSATRSSTASRRPSAMPS